MTLPGIVMIVVVLLAAVTDLLYGKIYNWVTYPAVVAGLVMSLVLPQGEFIDSLLGAVCAFLVFYLLHLRMGLGAGDVKLMAAVGALRGLGFVVVASYYTIFAGAILGLLVLAWRGRLLSSVQWLGLSASAAVANQPRPPKPAGGLNTMPFGPAICLGVMYATWLRSRGELQFGPFTF